MSPPWPMVPLGQFMSQRPTDVEVSPNQRYHFAGVYCFGRGLFPGPKKLGIEFAYKRLTQLRADDFVYPKLMAWEGALGVVPPAYDGYYVSTEFPVFEINEQQALPRFLDLYFRRPSVWPELSGGSTGTNVRRRRLHPDSFLRYRLPLPSLPEQQRLVERIDVLATKIEEAKQLRQDADEMCTAISNAEMERSLSTLTDCEIKPLREVADCRLGKMLSGNQTDDASGTPYLRNANIQWDRLDLRTVFRMVVSREDQIALSLMAGDILACEGGDIGKCAIWNDEIPGCIFQKALHRVRVKPSVVLPRYLLHYLIWAAKRGDFSAVKTQTTIAHLTGVVLNRFQVKVPSLGDQARIVSRLDTLQQQLGNIRRVQADSRVELDALLQAILDRAFRGEL
jgi:type I restriction enzyme, S subunit